MTSGSDHPHAHAHSPNACHGADRSDGGHDHLFLADDHDRNARRTSIVIAITLVMMVAEIAAGTVYGSMALVADGWHMATHAAALLIAALAYRFARSHAHDPRFTFGTGKVGDLAAFASAVILGLVALLIGWESLLRLASPVEIGFAEAIGVAVIGLVVNLGCAWLLGAGDHHARHHGHSHAHHHDHAHSRREAAPHRDNNLRAAYFHVLADALTSVLAIFALIAARLYGWLWIDPLIGVVGALVIARWSLGLMRDSGRVLIDCTARDDALPRRIRAALECETDRITDLHVWQVGPGHHAAILSLTSSSPRDPAAYKARLAHLAGLSHVTVEVEPA
jgi:cation diffusion facilitator family transporter